MINGIRVKKIQTGIHLTIGGQNLLRMMASVKGLTNSVMAETAIKEYAFNHREELRYLNHLIDGNKISF